MSELTPASAWTPHACLRSWSAAAPTQFPACDRTAKSRPASALRFPRSVQYCSSDSARLRARHSASRFGAPGLPLDGFKAPTCASDGSVASSGTPATFSADDTRCASSARRPHFHDSNPFASSALSDATAASACSGFSSSSFWRSATAASPPSFARCFAIRNAISTGIGPLPPMPASECALRRVVTPLHFFFCPKSWNALATLTNMSSTNPLRGMMETSEGRFW
mmetsp:Transcript_35832/g.107832  ORF Transcript_35832/g.107832 Transcript_35832/m.107832 type:complete len:224 (+) Transcript_35832:266-937(+)